MSLRKLRRLRRDNVAKFLNLSNLPINPISDRTCGRAPIQPIQPIQPILPVLPIPFIQLTHPPPQKTHKKAGPNQWTGLSLIEGYSARALSLCIYESLR